MKMKIILFSFFLLSCQYITLKNDNVWQFEIPQSYVYDEKVNFNSVENITLWVHNNIKYEYDEVEYFRTPQETLDYGKGDCDCMSLLIVGLSYKYLDKKMNCLKLFTHPEGVGKIFPPYHKIAESQGIWYDGTSGKSRKAVESEVCYREKFDNIVNWIKLMRWKKIK